MAIDTITPPANNVVEPGDSLSFRVDDTYTFITIEVETASGWEYAYDSALGGAQAGYVVTVEDLGSRHEFVVVRSVGFDLNPFQVRVTEDESGATTATTTAYYLASEVSFPRGSDPYYGNYSGSFLITDNNVAVRSDVRWLNIEGTGYTLSDDGPGKVTLTLTGGGGGGVTDHGALTGLGDDDHTQYVLATGARAQDGVFLTERADHVNTPAAGRGELWLRNDAVQSLILTDDTGADRHVPALDPAGNGSKIVAANAAGTRYEFVSQRVVMGIVARFQCVALNTWYSADSSGKDSVWSTAYGAGTDPIANTVVMHTPCSIDANVVEHVTWVRAGSTGNVAEFAFYENRLTDNSAVASIGKIGTTLTLPAAGTSTSGNMYDLSGTFVSSNLLHEDGFLSPFARTTAGPTSAFFQFRSTLFLDLV
jgi:hypothetical protein